MTDAPKFHVGQVVAYVETRPIRKVICLATVSFVGKRDVRIGDSQAFNVSDGTRRTSGVYRYRAIEPLTPEVLAEAKKHGAVGLELATS